MNKILQSIFKIWNFLPLFQMLFLWLNKTPPKWDPPLSVQDGFDISFMKYYFLPLLNTKFLKLVVEWSFCFGLILSPPLAWIAKNGIIRALEVLSSPLIITKWVEIIPKTKSFCSLPQRKESGLERRRRMSYGVEAFVFAQDSNSLSIHLWLGLK
jgi:hypothetical protein